MKKKHHTPHTHIRGHKMGHGPKGRGEGSGDEVKAVHLGKHENKGGAEHPMDILHEGLHTQCCYDDPSPEHLG